MLRITFYETKSKRYKIDIQIYLLTTKKKEGAESNPYPLKIKLNENSKNPYIFGLNILYTFIPNHAKTPAKITIQIINALL